MAHGYRYLTREELTRCCFAKIGEDVQVHELADIVGAERIRLGSHVRIDGFINLVARKQHLRARGLSVPDVSA